MFPEWDWRGWLIWLVDQVEIDLRVFSVLPRLIYKCSKSYVMIQQQLEFLVYCNAKWLEGHDI